MDRRHPSAGKAACAGSRPAAPAPVALPQAVAPLRSIDSDSPPIGRWRVSRPTGWAGRSERPDRKSREADWAALHRQVSFRRSCFTPSVIRSNDGWRPVGIAPAESDGAHDQADAGLHLPHGHRYGEIIPRLNARPLEQRDHRGPVRPLLLVGECSAALARFMRPFIQTFLELARSEVSESGFVGDLPRTADN